MHFALDDQIASQPAAIRNLLERIQVPTLDRSKPVIFTGIGTSLHACTIAAQWTTELSGGTLRPTVVNAHELALSAPIRAGDQIVVVSHRGNKRFPNEVLAKAQKAGATTIAISGEETSQIAADVVLRTCPGERSGTHTVSYVTALTALGRLVAALVGPDAEILTAALESVPAAITDTLAFPAPIQQAEHLSGHEPILVVGTALDAVTAYETALKIKEGTYQWAEGMSIEQALHGPPAAFRAGMGAITITPDGDDGGRTQTLRVVLADLGVEALTCGVHDEDLRFASVPRLVRPLVAIVPLQRVVAEMARIRKTNPDAIHRDIEPWNTVMGLIAL
jgi:glucosamine--fructose-6-phosphate aminotransferase (isomerizing)